MNSFLYMYNRNRVGVFINYRCGSRSKCKHNDSKSALLAFNKLCISALVEHTELYNISYLFANNSAILSLAYHHSCTVE